MAHGIIVTFWRLKDMNCFLTDVSWQEKAKWNTWQYAFSWIWWKRERFLQAIDRDKITKMDFASSTLRKKEFFFVFVWKAIFQSKGKRNYSFSLSKQRNKILIKKVKNFNCFAQFRPQNNSEWNSVYLKRIENWLTDQVGDYSFKQICQPRNWQK